MHRSVLVAFVAAIQTALALTVHARQAQQSPDTLPTFRAGVDVVRLDVSVLDSNRKPVRGLTAADFTILEDNIRQSIVAFQAFDIPDLVLPNTTWMREVAPDVATNRLFTGRMVIVLVNDRVTRGNYWTAKTASRIADKVLDQIRPDDLAAVVYLGRNTAAQTFTADRSLLRAAFTDIKNVRPPPLSSKFICGPGAAAVEALGRIADALKGEPSIRKAVLFVTPSFPEFPTRDVCMNGEMAEFLRQAAQSNISVYPVDPGAFLGDVNEHQSGLEGLRYLAASTGGRAVIHDKHDNPEAEIPALFEENNSHYLLGFQSTNPQIDQHYRTLTVTVHRPGVTVRYRNGYYAGPPKAAKKTPVLTPLEQAATGLLPAAQLPLRLAAAPVWVPGKKYPAVAISVGIRQEAHAPAEATRLSVLSTAFDLEGESQGEMRQQIDLSSSGAADRSRRVDILSRLDLPPGRYDLRVAIEDGAGRRGSVFTSLDVPDFTKRDLALSGATIARAGAESTPTDALATVLPVVPTSERSFTRSDRAQVFLQVYEPRRGPRAATITATIVDETDRRVFAQTTALAVADFAKSKGVNYRLDLPLDALAPGAYLLSITASTDEGKATAERRVRFEVE